MTEIYNLWVSSGQCLIGLLLLLLVVLTACLDLLYVLICPLNDVWLSCRHLLVHCMLPKRGLYRSAPSFVSYRTVSRPFILQYHHLLPATRNPTRSVSDPLRPECFRACYLVMKIKIADRSLPSVESGCTLLPEAQKVG